MPKILPNVGVKAKRFVLLFFGENPQAANLLLERFCQA